MKLLLDQNPSFKLVAALKHLESLIRWNAGKISEFEQDQAASLLVLP